MSRQLAATLIVLAFLFSGPRGSFNSSAQQTSEPASATKTTLVPGLRDKVTVRRDERGIPYIEAKNDEDLYFAQAL